MKDLEKKTAYFAEMIRKIKEAPEFRIERLKFEIAEDMCRYMDSNEVSRTELAERLGTSRAYITKMLRGNCNFTLESMDRIAAALDCELSVRLCPEGFGPSHIFVQIEEPKKEISFDKMKNLHELKKLSSKEITDETSNAA